MKTRLIANLTALTLAATAGTSALADESGVELAWQQPGYVTEVVVVTAPRPAVDLVLPDETAQDEQAATGEAALAYLQPGYEQEVVVVTAKRVNPIEQYRAMAREAAIERERIRATRFLPGISAR